ncbi:hypothetical protein [Thermosulfurimonas sp. F29]|uniref:hypothetical protein n=1 Tax=Thermosulfurimonas sp. F29 TaxID=2867247 RepID=UPI001C83E481|nr:hypothetical protein [Thermosulfurimonas sp. F29]MBX6422632.1 hypothetical protein [Thermosulfurimonas sp. F29]
MARLCTLKDWLEAFSRKQEEDLQFLLDLLERPRVSVEISRELQNRLRQRRLFSSFFKKLTWHQLSLEELEWCERKMEEILRREEEIKTLLDRLLVLFGEPENS